MALLTVAIQLMLAPAVFALATLLVNIARGVLSRLAKHALLRHVRGPPRTSLLAGNLHELYDIGGLPHLEGLSQYGGVAKVHGLFGDVLLAVSDPLALTHILVNAIQSFPAIDVSGTLDVHHFLMGPGLLSTNGPEHRRQRKFLNPVFSHARMRDLTPLMREISDQLRDCISREIARDPTRPSHANEIDLAEELGRAALEFIGQAGYGHSFHAFEGNSDEYVHAVKDLVPTFAIVGPFVPLFVLSGASRLPPSLLRSIGQAASFLSASLRHLLQIVDLMNDEMHVICEARKVAQKEGEHKELLGALFEANEEGQVSDDELTAQAITLLIAGAETTSTALCRIFHQLAMYPTVQEMLRQEIVQAPRSLYEGHQRGLDYDVLMALPFFDAVCKETLRLFAPAPLRNRRCVEESVIPLSDGTSIHIPIGTEVLINVHGVNTDVKLWGSDAHMWRPERWLEPLPEKVASMPGVYANTLTFMAGPKSCIGLNFALLEMKTVLATLLPAFNFKLPSNDEIEWRFGQTITPNVRGEKGLNPRMPLLVECL